MEELLPILITLFLADYSSAVSDFVSLYTKQNFFQISKAGWFILQYSAASWGVLDPMLSPHSAETTQTGVPTKGKDSPHDEYFYGKQYHLHSFVFHCFRHLQQQKAIQVLLLVTTEDSFFPFFNQIIQQHWFP